jgi:hypothetical protein
VPALISVGTSAERQHVDVSAALQVRLRCRKCILATTMPSSGAERKENLMPEKGHATDLLSNDNPTMI